MKLLLSLLILFIPLFAQGEAYAYKEKKGHFAYFVKFPKDSKQLQRTAGKKAVVYYKNGTITEAARYVTNDRVQIAFSQTPDLDAFGTKFSLAPLVRLGKNVYVFENRSELDDVELCAKLWEEAGILYARPVFKSKKKLQ